MSVPLVYHAQLGPQRKSKGLRTFVQSSLNAELEPSRGALERFIDSINELSKTICDIFLSLLELGVCFMFHVLRYVPTGGVRNITKSGSNARVAKKATRGSAQEL